MEGWPLHYCLFYISIYQWKKKVNTGSVGCLPLVNVFTYLNTTTYEKVNAD